MVDEVQGGRYRPAWEDLPATVQRRIEALAGSNVAHSRSAVGGFSPGFASRLDLEDGRRLFVKAMSDSLTPGGADRYRRERDILQQLPAEAPTARLVSTDDDGEWVILVYDYIDGRNPIPSRPDDLAAMLAAYTNLVRVLTPTPIRLGHIRDRSFDHWARLRAEGGEPSIAEYTWASANLDLLARPTTSSTTPAATPIPEIVAATAAAESWRWLLIVNP